MIEMIRERFINGYYDNNNFTERDLFYIKRNDELKKLLINRFFEGKRITVEKISNDLDETILSDYNLHENDHDYRINFMYKLFDYTKGNGIDLDIIKAWPIFFKLPNEIENFNRYVMDKIKNGGSKISLSIENINYILDNKLYDLFMYLNETSYIYLNEATKNRLEKEYKENNFELPSSCKKVLDLNAKSLSFEELLYKLHSASVVSNSNFNPSSYVFECIRRLKGYINDPDNHIIEEEYKGISYIDHILINSLNNYELLELLKRGVITRDIINHLLGEGVISFRKFENIIIDLVKKSDNPIEFIERISDILPNGLLKYDLTDDITEIDLTGLITRIVNRIIEEGYGFGLINDNLTKKQIDRIKEIFFSGKNKINEELEIYSFDTMDIDLLKFLVDNSKIKKVSFSNDGDYYRAHLEKTDMLERMRILKDCLLKNKDLEVQGISVFDKEVFDILLEREEYDILSSSINLDLSGNMSETFLSWLQEHSDDTFLFHKIINHYVFGMNYNEKMFYQLLNNEFILDELINVVIHNDSIKEKFSMEFYSHARETLAKKYDLNIENMDYLTNRFGPNIIMYLEDKNIQKIINLSEDKFNKLMSLFPIEDYSLVDIEAAYESINQYNFGREPINLEIINIFPNMLRAINDNNIDLINKYKYKLLSTLDMNTIKNIMNKYSFNGTPIEFIDYILSNLKDENVNILHEIANNAILLERKYYRNNHYYVENNDYKISNLVKECIESTDYLRSVIESISSSDLVDIMNMFGIKKVEEFKNLMESSNPDDILMYSYILESITKKMINCEREKNPIGYTIFDELGLPYDLEEKRKKNEVEKYFIRNYSLKLESDVYDRLKDNPIFTQDFVYTLFYCFASNRFNILSDEERKYIGLFTKTATEIVRENIAKGYSGYDKSYVENAVNTLDNERRLKRIYKPSKQKDFYSILINLNLDLIDKNVFENEEIFNLLKEVMATKKIHLLDPSFFNCTLSEKSTILEDEASLSGFINFFKVIVDKTNIPYENKEKMLSYFSIAEILRQSSAYSSMSSIYSSILGEEDARLIKRNPDPNSAKMKDANKRFDEAVADTISCYKKLKISVPSLDKVIPVSDGKSIEVIVGNFTSPCNITHGERTGACMRIGGVGEALYKFCINEDNGFHIRFEDPKTHKYISRVSGFRNGNSVYLNQLRDSLSNKYSNSDLIDATKKIAQMMIENSKDSDYPIQNVFITEGFAMFESSDEKIKLDSSEIIKGLGKIYTDYTYSKAFLLASVQENGYVPLESKKVPPLYDTQRSKPKIIMDDLEIAPNYINRVHTINQLIQGKDLDKHEIDVIEFTDDLLYCIVNDDWYLYVDKNYDIKTEFISTDKRAKEEMNKYRVIVEEMIQKGLVKEKSHEQL